MITNGQIAREILGKGWEIRYRGGNSVCATPSDLDLIVADAPRAPGGEASPSRYSIATWHSVEDGPRRSNLTLFSTFTTPSVASRCGFAGFPTQSKRRSSSSATAYQSQRHGISSVRGSAASIALKVRRADRTASF